MFQIKTISIIPLLHVVHCRIIVHYLQNSTVPLKSNDSGARQHYSLDWSYCVLQTWKNKKNKKKEKRARKQISTKVALPWNSNDTKCFGKRYHLPILLTRPLLLADCYFSFSSSFGKWENCISRRWDDVTRDARTYVVTCFPLTRTCATSWF